MTNLCWHCAERTARLLERDECEAVLGDLQETGENAWSALLEISGLVVRRRLALWKDWRPWLASFGLALPCSLLLMGFSLTVSQTYQRLIDATTFNAGGLRMGPGFLLLAVVRRGRTQSVRPRLRLHFLMPPASAHAAFRNPRLRDHAAQGLALPPLGARASFSAACLARPLHAGNFLRILFSPRAVGLYCSTPSAGGYSLQSILRWIADKTGRAPSSYREAPKLTSSRCYNVCPP